MDIIYYINNPRLSNYNPDYYGEALNELVEKVKPDLILVGATSIGSELAPTVAAKLKTGLAAHCVDIFVNNDDDIVQLVPAFGGKVLGEILIPNHRPMMATVKPGVFSKKDIIANSDIQTIEFRSSVLGQYNSSIEFVGCDFKKENVIPLEKADIVICAGMGIGNNENWEKIKELADVFNAAVGYTRPVIDLGLANNEDNMIGTSGKTIRPKVYIGFGVSGASHHVCGMKDSGLIININSDENAEIFEASDYKVISNCETILDALLEHFRLNTEEDSKCM